MVAKSRCMKHVSLTEAEKKKYDILSQDCHWKELYLPRHFLDLSFIMAVEGCVKVSNEEQRIRMNKKYK